MKINFVSYLIKVHYISNSARMTRINITDNKCIIRNSIIRNNTQLKYLFWFHSHCKSDQSNLPTFKYNV